jgi:acetylornithine deacetylase/succinyl-diaminopimelate desuccinylase-like protein
MPLDLVQTLSDLISLPSVNPMGRPLSGPEFFEYRVTDYLEQLFRRLKLPYERQTVEPKRDNIIARMDGDLPPSEGGELILFEAHQDTVPVDGMTIEPWTPVVRDGRIYGRGACDIKGGMCAMLGAVARLAEERAQAAATKVDGSSRPRPTVIMACTVNEEHGYTGALALPKLWENGHVGNVPHAIVPRKPDIAVIAEPTLLNVVVAHKGAVRWRCHTRGRACHSSQPHLGDNALYKMARVLQALEAYQREVVPTLPKHLLCGPASLSVGTIGGGLSVNTVPDECSIEIDRRVLPGEDSQAVYRGVIDFVSRQPSVNFEPVHDKPFMDSRPLPDDCNGGVAERLLIAARAVTGKSEAIGVPFGTDASTISLAGVPSVVFGPGSIDQAHTADEWLEIEQLRLASEVLYRFVRG